MDIVRICSSVAIWILCCTVVDTLQFNGNANMYSDVKKTYSKIEIEQMIKISHPEAQQGVLGGNIVIHPILLLFSNQERGKTSIGPVQDDQLFYGSKHLQEKNDVLDNSVEASLAEEGDDVELVKEKTEEASTAEASVEAHHLVIHESIDMDESVVETGEENDDKTILKASSGKHEHTRYRFDDGVKHNLAIKELPDTHHDKLPEIPGIMTEAKIHRKKILTRNNSRLNDNISSVVPGSSDTRMKRSFRYFRTRRKSTSLVIELLMVADYAVYQWWNKLVSELPDIGADVTDLIREYYGYIVRGIDLRFQSIDKQSFQMNVAFAGLHVATTEAESYWTTTSTLDGDGDSSRPMVNSSEALDKFQRWLDSASDLPYYNHAILFTGTNLTYAGNAGNTGLAFGSSMCLNISNSSIVEDLFDFRTITFAAQQLARSLGSNDDMDNNDCLEFFNYIMVPKFRLPIRSFAANRWKFSSCSQQYMSDYLTGLEDIGLNCLLHSSINISLRYPTTLGTDPLGFIYSAKRQCQHRFGAGSGICRLRIGTGYSKVCSGLLCSIADLDACAYILPADGTPCGNRKYCWHGACKEFDDAAVASDTCVFGNDPNMDCVNIVQNDPSLCYKEMVRYSCCQACEEVALDVPGCEFGDRLNNCTMRDCIYGDETYVSVSCCLTCSDGPTAYPQSTDGTLLTSTKTSPSATITTPSTAIRSSTNMSPRYSVSHQTTTGIQDTTSKPSTSTNPITSFNSMSTFSETHSTHALGRSTVTRPLQTRKTATHPSSTPSGVSTQTPNLGISTTRASTVFKSPSPETTTASLLTNTKSVTGSTQYTDTKPSACAGTTNRPAKQATTSRPRHSKPSNQGDGVTKTFLRDIARTMRRSQRDIRDGVHVDMYALYHAVSASLRGRHHEYENESEVYREGSEMRSGDEENINTWLLSVWMQHYQILMTNLNKSVRDMRYKVMANLYKQYRTTP